MVNFLCEFLSFICRDFMWVNVPKNSAFSDFKSARDLVSVGMSSGPIPSRIDAPVFFPGMKGVYRSRTERDSGTGTGFGTRDREIGTYRVIPVFFKLE